MYIILFFNIDSIYNKIIKKDITFPKYYKKLRNTILIKFIKKSNNY